jgi:hypothetical protein
MIAHPHRGRGKGERSVNLADDPIRGHVNRAEALKLLRLDSEHDAHAIEQSYWSLVRRAQTRDEGRAAREIERLNEAYAMLAPHGEPMSATARRASSQVITVQRPSATVAPTAPAFFFPDEILAWFGREARRVRGRWAGRNPEIALIGGALVVLVGFAIKAGIDVVPLVVCVAVIVAAVWAPWRRSLPHE